MILKKSSLFIFQIVSRTYFYRKSLKAFTRFMNWKLLNLIHFFYDHNSIKAQQFFWVLRFSKRHLMSENNRLKNQNVLIFWQLLLQNMFWALRCIKICNPVTSRNRTFKLEQFINHLKRKPSRMKNKTNPSMKLSRIVRYWKRSKPFPGYIEHKIITAFFLISNK